MGLFKTSNRNTQVPLPAINIFLASQQDIVFKPNDTVTGHVTITAPYPITPQTIEVSLWSESKTWIQTISRTNDRRTYRHYRDHAPLFNVTSNVLPPHPQTLLPGQTYTFPFSFRVPQGTGFNRSGCYQDATDRRWTVFPHNLPPTFFVGTSPDWPDNCSIAYGVTATLLCQGIGNTNPISSTAPILFQPLNTHAQNQTPNGILRYPQTFTLSSSTLTGLDAAAISFRQRMHDRISSATPKLAFELGIEIPDLLTSGSEFRFRTTFNVKSKTPNATYIPAMAFTVLELALLDFTFYRAPRDWDAMSTVSGDHWQSTRRPLGTAMGFQGEEETVYREKKTPLNSIPESQIVELPEVQVGGEKKGLEQAQHCEHWWTGRVPGFTPPSFVSFAVSRMYRVKLKMGVEIGGKKFEFEAESHVKELGSVPGQLGV